MVRQSVRKSMRRKTTRNYSKKKTRRNNTRRNYSKKKNIKKKYNKKHKYTRNKGGGPKPVSGFTIGEKEEAETAPSPILKRPYDGQPVVSRGGPILSFKGEGEQTETGGRSIKVTSPPRI